MLAGGRPADRQPVAARRPLGGVVVGQVVLDDVHLGGAPRAVLLGQHGRGRRHDVRELQHLDELRVRLLRAQPVRAAEVVVVVPHDRDAGVAQRTDRPPRLAFVVAEDVHDVTAAQPAGDHAGALGVELHVGAASVQLQQRQRAIHRIHDALTRHDGYAHAVPSPDAPSPMGVQHDRDACAPATGNPVDRSLYLPAAEPDSPESPRPERGLCFLRPVGPSRPPSHAQGHAHAQGRHPHAGRSREAQERARAPLDGEAARGRRAHQGGARVRRHLRERRVRRREERAGDARVEDRPARGEAARGDGDRRERRSAPTSSASARRSTSRTRAPAEARRTRSSAPPRRTRPSASCRTSRPSARR